MCFSSKKMECNSVNSSQAVMPLTNSITALECLQLDVAVQENCEQELSIIGSQQPSSDSPFTDVPASPMHESLEKAFHIDSAAIRSVPINEQAEELRALGLNVYDQTVLEKGILEQVDKAFQQQEAQRQKQIAQKALKTVLEDVRAVKIRLKHIDKALAMMPKVTAGMSKEVKRKIEAIQKEKENKLRQLKTLRAKQRSLVVHAEGVTLETYTDVESEGEELDPETKFQIEQVLNIDKAKETEQEKLIRTGHMTPFGTVLSAGAASRDAKQQQRNIVISQELTDFERYLLDQEQQQQQQQIKKKTITLGTSTKRSKNHLLPTHKKQCKMREEKMEETDTSDSEMIAIPSTSKQCPPLIPKPKRKHYRKADVGTLIQGKDDKKIRRKKCWWPDPDANCIDLEELQKAQSSSGSEYAPSSSEYDDEEEEQKLRSAFEKKRRKKIDEDSDVSDFEEKRPPKMGRKKIVDDGNQSDYIKRIKKWKKTRLLKKYKNILQETEVMDENEEEEGFEEFDGGYRIPLKIWNKLYRYQQTCVRWLWELHSQKCGGIIGDEMGLGKTIEAIAYFAGLSLSNVRSPDCKFKGLGPVIIIAPTTVMHQWVKEFHMWWPPFRVAILHESGSYSGTKESLVRHINSFPGILITSYSGLTIHQDILLKYNWHYILLDEGHKIRNPDARATLVCKQFRTPHRFILSGSPLQNHLKELWSLFDFIFPGKLGTLPVFMQQFAVPITHGGYSNASQVQVQTAYKCAVVLRDTISPYLLRRMKSDVKMNLSLPNKNEQVLFCRLTDEQREHYKQYLDSKEIQSILSGRLQVFVGLINLRKICNHPDLYSGGPKLFGEVDSTQLPEDMYYGYWKRSGKMLVIEAILKLWHCQGHRVLLFSQSKQMLDILERFIKIQNYTYFRMDGGTSIGSRQPLVNKFNTDSSIFVFLLTTRVGGLGVNLTGANRVIIYDPDWNPSTDLQARERAWRIGQTKDVTIYRLLTSGTIEEKIYHRQIFKQFLTNRVLKDPRQRRFFKSNDLFELFVLRDEGTEGTETSAIFAGTGSEVKVTPKKMAVDDRNDESGRVGAKSSLPEKKIEKMRELARKLSKKIAEKAHEGSTSTLLNGEAAAETCSRMNSEEHCLIKTKKPKNKKNKHSKGAKFEGIKVNFLDHKDTYASTGQVDEEMAKSVKQDEYVLQKLFAKSGVHTALKHDTIVDASDPDYMLVEGEADRVAKEAVKALKVSRRQCYRAEAGIPTWTGSNGFSGAPAGVRAKARFGQKKNSKLLLPDKAAISDNINEPVKVSEKPFGSKKVFTGESELANNGSTLSSNQLLLKMKQRNHLNPATAHSDEDECEDQEAASSNAVQNRLTTQYDELLVDIRNFIALECTIIGEASTEDILNHFKERIPAHDSAVFKALLQRICTFIRNSSGVGVWRLKGEFR